MVFWLCAWAVLAADYVLFKGIVCLYDGCEAFSYAEDTNSTFAATVGVWQATIVLGVVQL